MNLIALSLDNPPKPHAKVGDTLAHRTVVAGDDLIKLVKMYVIGAPK